MSLWESEYNLMECNFKCSAFRCPSWFLCPCQWYKRFSDKESSSWKGTPRGNRTQHGINIFISVAFFNRSKLCYLQTWKPGPIHALKMLTKGALVILAFSSGLNLGKFQVVAWQTLREPLEALKMEFLMPNGVEYNLIPRRKKQDRTWLHSNTDDKES